MLTNKKIHTLLATGNENRVYAEITAELSKQESIAGFKPFKLVLSASATQQSLPSTAPDDATSLTVSHLNSALLYLSESRLKILPISALPQAGDQVFNLTKQQKEALQQRGIPLHTPQSNLSIALLISITFSVIMPVMQNEAPIRIAATIWGTGFITHVILPYAGQTQYIPQRIQKENRFPYDVMQSQLTSVGVTLTFGIVTFKAYLDEPLAVRATSVAAVVALFVSYFANAKLLNPIMGKSTSSEGALSHWIDFAKH